jgi:hypothetical protein
MTDQPTWHDLVAAARRRADPALRMIGIPDAALTEETAAAVDELVEVVLVQQDLIENLLKRMSALERHVHRPAPGAEATG